MAQDSGAARVLRELRQRQGRSLRLAAGELGVAPSHLSRIERGERSPGGDLERKIASYYGVSPDTLALADGRLPADVVEILLTHPQEVERLRSKYGG